MLTSETTATLLSCDRTCIQIGDNLHIRSCRSCASEVTAGQVYTRCAGDPESQAYNAQHRPGCAPRLTLHPPHPLSLFPSTQNLRGGLALLCREARKSSFYTIINIITSTDIETHCSCGISLQSVQHLKAAVVMAQDQYRVLGEQVQAVQAEQMRNQLASFKRSLEEFAISHRCGI